MIVVYASTRNWYKHLPTAIGSLLVHNPDAFVYIIAEDDQIECIKRKRNIKIINKNNFPNFIDLTHPNANTHWTVFSLMRCFLTKMINEDKIIWLDVDTIVTDSLDELWEMDMTNYAVAGWREQPKNWQHIKSEMTKSEYINSGVMVMNLKFIREHGFDDKFISYLSGKRLKNPDQDAINSVCNGYIRYFCAEYNYGVINSDIEKRLTKHYKIYHMTWYKLWDNPKKGPPNLWNSYYRETLW